MKRNSTLLAVIVCSAILSAGNVFAADSGSYGSGSNSGTTGTTTGGSMGNTTTDTTGAGTGNVAQPGQNQPGQAGQAGQAGTMGTTTNPSGMDKSLNSNGTSSATGTNTTPHNSSDDSSGK